jgi:16S rRNA (guanine966-N2)-methyltransferase
VDAADGIVAVPAAASDEAGGGGFVVAPASSRTGRAAPVAPVAVASRAGGEICVSVGGVSGGASGFRAGLRLKRSNIGERQGPRLDGRHAGKLQFYRSMARRPALGPPPRPASPPHRIRIIGGRHRGRHVRVPDVEGLRPTPDRVRETLFNWLGQDLTGAATLDLYAGSGVLTLEALSRGATLAVAVDRHPGLVRALGAAAQTVQATGIETHVDDALRYLARETRVFDVVFLDPPFADDPWPALFAALSRVVAPRGRVYAEAGRALEPPPSWRTVRHARAGQVHYHLLAPAPAPCDES